MQRESKEKNHHNTSQSPSSQPLNHHEITAKNIDIPLDLTVEILKKLPVKSLLRFRCVSKQWSSIISSRRDFIDAIVTRSLTQPRPYDTQLIFHHLVDHVNPNFFILSSTYPQNTDNESVSTTAGSYQHVRGLICCWSACPTTVDIYNPTTRQYFTLSETMRDQGTMIDSCFFGYDPIENKYKVMCLPQYDMEEALFKVFTVGDPTNKPWRNVQGIGFHVPLFPAVCVNGTIYYRATNKFDGTNYFLVSFDVRFEKFNYVKSPKTLKDHDSTLINYQGKLGFMCCEKGVEIWIMEDVEKKQEWSKMIFYEMEGLENQSIAGVTHGGEIVFVRKILMYFDTLYVRYYEPKRNSMRFVEVEGTMVENRERERKHLLPILVVPDLVENTMRLSF